MTTMRLSSQPKYSSRKKAFQKCADSGNLLQGEAHSQEPIREIIEASWSECDVEALLEQILIAMRKLGFIDENNQKIAPLGPEVAKEILQLLQSKN